MYPYVPSYRRFMVPKRIEHFCRRCYSDSSTIGSFLSKFALINVRDRFENVAELADNYAARDRKPRVKIETLKTLCSILEKHYRYKYGYSVPNKPSVLKSNDGVDADFQSGTSVGRYHKAQFEVFDDYYKHLRSVIIDRYLSIPNALHERTPRGIDDEVIHEKIFSSPGNRVDFNDHISVGEKLDVLRYSDHSAYYLMKEAAEVEIGVVRFLNHALEKEAHFLPFRNPDTCNDFIIHAVSGDNNENEAFYLDDSVYRLVGGASLAAFCAFRTSESVRARFLPERFFTHGRRYIPPSLHEDGLYTVCQRTNVHLIVAASSKEQLTSEFDSLLDWLKSFYDRLGLDYRICYSRASELTITENCRAKLQLHSPYRNSFVDIGSLSMYDDFLSKRLRMFFHPDPVNKYFLYVMDGVVVSVPILIACLLERSVDKFLIPECIRPFMLKSTAQTIKKK